MKDFEIHAHVSYISGGQRYEDCYAEIVSGNTKAEAKKKYKAELDAEGIKLLNTEIFEVK